MSQDIYNLFVYGSLRSGFRNPVYQYLTKYFHFVGEAVVKGKLYDLGEYPAATATSEEHFISGELYCINNPLEFSWAIGQLDDYEGVNAEPGERPWYKRDEVIAYHQGEPHTAWIYWYNGDISGKPEIESGDLMQYLQQKNKP
ncbi:MAG TPA: gamma-glutamylcyclotransferase [Ferruginibacter sp.]|nr:gamma-glutamylcyclotransferase [Chitinophagaceae bacterium]HQW92002.1 gamma-glutamylcyclotransferase [Ferruginibacter sp.]